MVPFMELQPDQTLEPAVPGEGREVPLEREELVVATRPFSPAAEQFRRLRNSLQALNPDGAARSIFMTSAVDGEGKTVAAINLALAMAELSQLKVLVVEADFRAPALEAYLGLPRRQGFVDLIGGRLAVDRAVRSTSVPRLDVVSAGTLPDNPAQILNLDRVRSVLNTFKRRYDYVLIDAPSVLSSNDPSVLASVADGILLVVRLGMPTKPEVEEAYAMLESLGGNVLGTCVTGLED